MMQFVNLIQGWFYLHRYISTQINNVYEYVEDVNV